MFGCKGWIGARIKSKIVVQWTDRSADQVKDRCVGIVGVSLFCLLGKTVQVLQGEIVQTSLV